MFPCTEAWDWGVPNLTFTLSGEITLTVIKDAFGLKLGASEIKNWPSQFSGLNNFCISLGQQVAVMRAGEYLSCTTKHKCKAEIRLRGRVGACAQGQDGSRLQPD